MSITPRPLLRLHAYAQRELYVNQLFHGIRALVTLQASVPTVDVLTPYGLPEVIFMGRVNAGKSQLVNEVFKLRNTAEVGRAEGITPSLNFYRLRRPPGKPGAELVLVDAPGYGSLGRPELGELCDHYLRTREELRRVYVVINAVHGVTQQDKLILQHLEIASRVRGFTLQAILSKCDSVPRPLLPRVVTQRRNAILKCSPSCLPAIPTASSRRARFGFEDVRYSIVEACGLTQPLPPP